MVTEQEVMSALKYVVEPDLKDDIVTLGLVSDVKISDQSVSFTVQVSNPAMHSRKRMEEACEHHIHQKLSKDLKVDVKIEALPKNNERAPEQRKVLKGVKKVVAIASGKGGVGKSTVTANLAVGLAQTGLKVGVIDADIYGPSMPIMFNVQDEKPRVETIDGQSKMVPVEAHGVKLLSIGFFADLNQAVVWRGPMATRALVQMVNDVHWGELDILLIDLPPGTGDIHLSLVQDAPLDGAVIVTTPQMVSVADAKKGMAMFQLDQINVPIIGIIENMAYFTPAELPNNQYFIFGKGGAQHLVEMAKAPLLGQIPIVQSICESGDAGRPAIMQQDTPQSLIMKEIVQSFVQELEGVGELKNV